MGTRDIQPGDRVRIGPDGGMFNAGREGVVLRMTSTLPSRLWHVSFGPDDFDFDIARESDLVVIDRPREPPR